MAKEYEECYYCGKWGYLDEHHVFEGTADRAKSEKYGLKVKLCRSCHTAVHNGYGLEMRRELHEEFQKIFEMDHSREEFIKEFSCGSYL